MRKKKKFVSVSNFARRLNGLPELATCPRHSWLRFIAGEGCPNCFYLDALEAAEDERIEREEREARWQEETGEEW